jgi:hypothetical protein
MRARKRSGTDPRRPAAKVILILSALLVLPTVLAGEPERSQLRSGAAPPRSPRAAVVESPGTPPLVAPRVDCPPAPIASNAPAHAPHQLQGLTANIVKDPANGRIRVDTPDGPRWIRTVQTAAATGGDPFPGCLICHGDIENITTNMMGMEIDCTACHGGDAYATTEEEAHVHPNGNVTYDATVPPLDEDLEYQQFVNPSNLRVVHITCGTCHPTAVRDLKKSMMATAAGHYAGGLYQNGVVDTKTPVYGTFAVSDDDGEVPEEQGAVASLEDLLVYSGGDPTQFATHFAAVPSQACARCHLWSRGKGYRGAVNAEGVYRADGCAACHIPYANDGLSQSSDTAIDHDEPGHAMHHLITKQVPTEQCLHCHHRGARIGLSFTGRAQMPPRLPAGPGVPGTTDVRFNGNYHYTVDDTNPPDIHGELGLACIDCHVRSEIMGDGNIYGHMDQATKIECRTCHGTPDAPPTLADNDGMPLPNVAMDEGGGVTLTSKLDGSEHVTPLAMEVVSSNPTAACAMNGNHLKADGGLECYSCHSAWIPNCYGCHFERDERQMGLNLMTGEPEVGKVSTNNKIFETLRPFALGPNSEGRIAPYLVGCQPIADVTGPKGEKILDFVMPVTANGLSGLALNPVNPHTVRGVGEVRTCAECHRAPPSLGLGSGNYTIGRDALYVAGAAGTRVYDRKADPGRPRPGDAMPVSGPTRALASLPDVVEGTTDFLYLAQGAAGVVLLDRRPGASGEPVALIEGINAIDVSRAAGFLYVVDKGVGVRIYDSSNPSIAALVATVPVPGAVRVVPWGIHLLVAAGLDGLFIVNVADHEFPFIEGMVPEIDAVDLRPYAHYRSGPDFAARVYVADPGYGVRVVDLLPDYDIPLAGAVALDTYTSYVTAAAAEPSREHDYLYVAAGGAGLHVFDITDPDRIEPVSQVTDLGGTVADVDVVSQLAPPGVDDYAILANEQLGLQVVLVNDPHDPLVIGTVPDSDGASRLLVEVQPMDRFLDEQGHPLKENSHPFTGVLSREDIVRILSASIDCETGCDADYDGDGQVDVDDLIGIILAWGTDDPAADLDGDGVVDVGDLQTVITDWGPCG